MSIKIIHPHIVEDTDNGRPIITGTRTRVSNVVAYYKLGLSAEELAREFPHLGLAQIHDALSYYYENQEDIDKEIEEESEDNLKKALGL
jgi:uncharacterized protein (DUF433 family)